MRFAFLVYIPILMVLTWFVVPLVLWLRIDESHLRIHFFGVPVRAIPLNTIVSATVESGWLAMLPSFDRYISRVLWPRGVLRLTISGKPDVLISPVNPGEFGRRLMGGADDATKG